MQRSIAVYSLVALSAITSIRCAGSVRQTPYARESLASREPLSSTGCRVTFLICRPHGQWQIEHPDPGDGGPLTSTSICGQWSKTVPLNQRYEAKSWVTNLETGEEWCYLQWANCFDTKPYYATLGHSLCYDDMPTEIGLKRSTGEPRLVLNGHEGDGSKIVLPTDGRGIAGRGTLRIEIWGVVNEKYYCPELRIRWPDETETERVSDCDPYTEGIEYTYPSWAFTRWFGCGDNKIEVALLHAGEVFARSYFTFTVSCTDDTGYGNQFGTPRGEE